MKLLTRSSKNSMFAGIIGGFGEYFQVDATMLRVVFLFFVLVTGFFPGVIAYVIAMFIIPLDTALAHDAHDSHTQSQENKQHRP